MRAVVVAVRGLELGVGFSAQQMQMPNQWKTFPGYYLSITSAHHNHNHNHTHTNALHVSYSLVPTFFLIIGLSCFLSVPASALVFGYAISIALILRSRHFACQSYLRAGLSSSD